MDTQKWELNLEREDQDSKALSCTMRDTNDLLQRTIGVSVLLT